ncbi:MAG: DUF3618 domain-containing protein [Acidobacteriota bacterium]
MAEETGKLITGTVDPVARAAGADAVVKKESTADLPVSEEPQEAEHLKAQIAETRREMGETIGALQDRLSLANVSDQVSAQVSSAIDTAKEHLYEATLGKAVKFMKSTGEGISNSNIVKTVGSNPLPFALIGIGAGLLVYQGMSRGRNSIRRQYLAASEGETSQSDRAASASTANRRSAVNTIKEKAGTAIDGISHTASGAINTVKDTAGDVYDKAGEYSHAARMKYSDLLDDNPLVLGAIAAAVGAAVGMAIPSSTYEDEWMGKAKESLVKKAGESANQFVERARSAAGEVSDTIRSEAETILP